MNNPQADFDTATLPHVGNPLLNQIQDFIDVEGTEPPSLDPIGIVTRALRGRERMTFGLALVVGLLCGLIGWLVVQPVFQSLGMIRVLPRESKILYADYDDSRLRLFDAFTTAEMQFIQSRPVLDHALYLLKDERKTLPTLPDDVANVASMLDVTNKKGLISISARSSNPVIAASVVNAVLDAYQAHNDEARDKQRQVRERELSERETAFTTTLVSLNEEYLKIGGEHDAGTLAKAHTVKTTQLEVIEERITKLNNMVTQLQSDTGTNTDVGSVEIQRATLLDNALADMIYERARRLAAMETLRMRFQSIHPERVAAEAELHIMEAAITERREQITMLGKAGALTGGGDTEEDSVSDLLVIRNQLTDRLQEVQKEATSFNSRLVHIRMVAAEQKRVSQLLEETKRALDKVRLESQNDFSRSIQIVARGGVAERPIDNKAKPAALGGVMFGGLGTISLLVLLTIIQGRLRFSDNLGSKRQALLAATIAEGRTRSVENAANRVRNEIDLALPGIKGETLVVGVVNSTPKSGCSRLALELAATYRSTGQRVLLVEADKSQESLSNQLKIGPGYGLIAVAGSSANLEDCIHPIKPGGVDLDFLPMGEDNRGLAEFMRSELTLEEFRAALSSASTTHQVIVIDLGTLMPGRQSAIGAAISDQVVLVTAAGEDEKRVATACELLDRLTPKRYRLVFNRASSLDPQLRDDQKADVTTTHQGWLSRKLTPA